jgi:hypothetical protein
MPAVVISKDDKGNFTYKDAYSGQATDQLGNPLNKTTNTANTTTNGIQNAITSFKNAQIQSAMATLQKSRDAALSNLTAEKATIQPKYYQKRNAESVQSQLGAKNFAEFMAQRGGANSGTSSQAELARNVALQGNIGALNQQEAGDYATNARRVTDVQNSYESDLAAAKAGAEATAMQQMIQQMNADRSYQQAMDQFNKNFGLQEKSFGLQEAGVTGTYNGNQTFASKQADSYKVIQEAQLLGTYNGQSTLSAQQLAQQLAQQQWENAFTEKQFAADQAYKSAALARSSSGGGGNSGGSSRSLTSAELTALQNQAQNDAYAFINYLNGQGWDEASIRGEINRKASNGELDMVDIPKLMRYVEYDRYNFGSSE